MDLSQSLTSLIPDSDSIIRGSQSVGVLVVVGSVGSVHIGRHQLSGVQFGDLVQDVGVDLLVHVVQVVVLGLLVALGVGQDLACCCACYCVQRCS